MPSITFSQGETQCVPLETKFDKKKVDLESFSYNLVSHHQTEWVFWPDKRKLCYFPALGHWESDWRTQRVDEMSESGLNEPTVYLDEVDHGGIDALIGIPVFSRV